VLITEVLKKKGEDSGKNIESYITKFNSDDLIAIKNKKLSLEEDSSDEEESKASDKEFKFDKIQKNQSKD
jgi:hypothetical protein